MRGAASRTWRAQAAARSGAGDSAIVRVPSSNAANDWRGHRLRVDLVQADEPAFRRSNLPATLSFTGAELLLPAR
jgi:hypothetical protein